MNCLGAIKETYLVGLAVNLLFSAVLTGCSDRDSYIAVREPEEDRIADAGTAPHPAKIPEDVPLPPDLEQVEVVRSDQVLTSAQSKVLGGELTWISGVSKTSLADITEYYLEQLTDLGWDAERFGDNGTVVQCLLATKDGRLIVVSLGRDRRLTTVRIRLGWEGIAGPAAPLNDSDSWLLDYVVKNTKERVYEKRTSPDGRATARVFDVVGAFGPGSHTTRRVAISRTDGTAVEREDYVVFVADGGDPVSIAWLDETTLEVAYSGGKDKVRRELDSTDSGVSIACEVFDDLEDRLAGSSLSPDGSYVAVADVRSYGGGEHILTHLDVHGNWDGPERNRLLSAQREGELDEALSAYGPGDSPVLTIHGECPLTMTWTADHGLLVNCPVNSKEQIRHATEQFLGLRVTYEVDSVIDDA